MSTDFDLRTRDIAGRFIRAGLPAPRQLILLMSETINQVRKGDLEQRIEDMEAAVKKNRMSDLSMMGMET